ncbi:MAG: hypothetical protein Q4G18_13295 [Myroides sp.]|nr:hypothetical protein [Myroides sp.]
MHSARLQMSFKLSVVKKIEFRELSIVGACRKYSIQARSTLISWVRKFVTFNWENQKSSNIPKSPEQKIMELEAQVNILHKIENFSCKRGLCS